MSGQYSLENATLSIGSYTLTGFEGAADAVSFAPVGDDGDITYGINGEGVFVHTCNKGVIITIKTLQHTDANQILNDLRKSQINTPAIFKSLPIYYKDTINGDEIFITNCFFTTPPTITRGNAHNTTTWTLKGIKGEFNLASGAFK